MATTFSGLLDADEAHALRVAPERRDAVDGHADELAAVGDEHEVVVVGDEAQPTTLPLRSVVLMVMTPMPPRFLVG